MPTVREIKNSTIPSTRAPSNINHAVHKKIIRLQSYC